MVWAAAMFPNYMSPIATLFYESYESLTALEHTLEDKKENLQCIVGQNFSKDEIPFGKTQHPKLWDYADNVDTLDFLQKL